MSGNGFSSTISHFEADVVSASDYSPFGMQLVGRNFSTDKYRYGFNGKENDNEVKGKGNSLDFGARVYDPRIARFLSIDPLSQKYPSENNYAFVSNSPLLYVDPDGKDRIEYRYTTSKDGVTILEKITTKDVFRLRFHYTSDGLGFYITKHDYEVYTHIDHRFGTSIETQKERMLFGGKHQSEVNLLEAAQVSLTNSRINKNYSQFFIFGAGMEDLVWGDKANPNRPIRVIDFKEYQDLMDLITLGRNITEFRKELISIEPERRTEISLGLVEQAGAKDKIELKGNRVVNIPIYVDSTQFGTPTMIHRTSAAGSTPDTNFIYIQRKKKKNE